MIFKAYKTYTWREFNYRFKMTPDGCYMTRAEKSAPITEGSKASIMSKWQTASLLDGVISPMKWLDNLRAARGESRNLAKIAADCNHDFAQYCDVIGGFWDSNDYIQLAEMMAEKWHADKLLCFRFVLCNVYCQFVEGFLAEAEMIKKFGDLNVFWADNHKQISKESLDYNHGTDLIMYYNGRPTLVQVKVADNLGEAVDCFKKEKRYIDKKCKLIGLTGMVMTEDGEMVCDAAWLFVDRYDYNNIKFEYAFDGSIPENRKIIEEFAEF